MFTRCSHMLLGLPPAGELQGSSQPPTISELPVPAQNNLNDPDLMSISGRPAPVLHFGQHVCGRR